jgi:hypothetical protein
MGAPIKQKDGTLVGILLAGFGPELVTDAVKSPFTDVRLVLQQVVGSKRWPLADNGVGDGEPGSGRRRGGGAGQHLAGGVLEGLQRRGIVPGDHPGDRHAAGAVWCSWRW